MLVRLIASQWGINLFFISLLSCLVVLFLHPGFFHSLPLPDLVILRSFKTMFISIILEALPFILFGVLVSSFLQIFVSEKWIRRMIPRNPLLGILFACLLGIIFPVCECGLIPVVRRLIAKGMPLYAGVVFILVGPIVNPVVYAATYVAFRTRPEMLAARMGLALLVGFAAGLAIYLFVRKNQLKNSSQTLYSDSSGNAGEHRHAGRGGKISQMLEHAGSEFFEMGKYLMFGSIVTAAIQAFVPRGDLVDIGQGAFTSHLFMMGFAFVLSLCSTSDAFVASSFLNTFSAGSLLTFMVFGPMLDFKGSLMLLSVFKTRFVLLLALLIIVTVLTGSLLIEQIYL
ncbi:permease [Paenibacillus solisilvae]|uniref:Permease n=1 Tax=Paenibacillus solisilvae TaxID=2486751 RepID=A0ABW0W1H1_9BACL